MLNESVLDLDVGNTMTKWRIFPEGRRGIWPSNALSELMPDLKTTVGRIRVACVIDNVRQAEFAGKLLSVFGVIPEFACSSNRSAGVSNCYEVPDTLGVDRWLAAVAAWNRGRNTACLVIDAGTALTIDTVNDKGEFLGGYIMPGLATMRRSLNADTGRISIKEGGSPVSFGSVPSNTERAVIEGGLFAAIAAVEKAIRIFRATWPDGKVFLTGGDGHTIAMALDIESSYEPDLVIDGLQLVLP